jgi:uncharacterized protein YcaQ
VLLTGPEHPVLIGPFDNVIWDRKRTRCLFDFHYTFEAYKPAAIRKCGYDILALQHRGRLVERELMPQAVSAGRTRSRESRSATEVISTFAHDCRS